MVLSAYFSASETAFSALNRIKIKNLAADGNKRAKRVLKLTERYDNLLSTILIGNNIVNIAASALATVTAAILSDSNWAVTIGTAILTVVILIFGEIIPKSLAKESAEAFAMFSAPFMSFMMIILTPLNVCFLGIKKFVSKIFKPSEIDSEIEEELLTFVDEAESEGNLDEDESDLIRNAIEFNETVAEDIYTPRVDIVAVDLNDTPEEIEEKFYKSGYSRLPVYKDTLDNIIGVLNQKDFTNPNNEGVSLEKIMTKPVMVVPSMKISKLLSTLQQKKSHLAVVLDEFGGTLGIVTLEDVIEELVGEIWDEHDEVVEDFQPMGEGRYRVLGGASLDDMYELFEKDPPEENDSNTVGGWVTENCGKIPSVGEELETDDFKIFVTKSDEKHVEEVIIEQIKKTEEETEDKEK